LGCKCCGENGEFDRSCGETGSKTCSKTHSAGSKWCG
jgi:hypothetical protein